MNEQPHSCCRLYSPGCSFADGSQLDSEGLRQTLVTRNSRTSAISANVTRKKPVSLPHAKHANQLLPWRTGPGLERGPGPAESSGPPRQQRGSNPRPPEARGQSAAALVTRRGGRGARRGAGRGRALPPRERHGRAERAVPGEGRQRVGCFGCSLVRWGWQGPPPGCSTRTGLTLDSFL